MSASAMDQTEEVSVTNVLVPVESEKEFLGRLDAIKKSAPELFTHIVPMQISKSQSYLTRAHLATETEDSGFDSPRTPQTHRALNMILYRKHVATAVKSVAKEKLRAGGGALKQLPIMSYRQAILDLIAKNQVVLIRGATGSGKTTQVPQFILDSFIQQKRGTDCRIVCTQPRRVAAISIASRVAAERGEELGDGVKGSVGFLIRCESELPRPEGGNILYCTVGVLLRQLHRDPTLREMTHILVDEIHERSTESDVLLAVLKMLLPVRPDLRVIVMSATVQLDQFSAYFGNCPTLDVRGFNYSVKEVYMDEIQRQINMPLCKKDLKGRKGRQLWYKFITTLITNIHEKYPPGAILVFCAGYEDIERLYRSLKRTKDKTMRVDILHSLVPVRRDRIFNKAKEGERKIVLSTNVAESSITIDDVVYVVDLGKMKVMSYNEITGTYTLQNSYTTKANAMQRKGRAGRCQDGVVFRLYDREIYEKMDDYMWASVTRERLDSVLLDLMVWNFGPVKEFLASLVSPPPGEKIDRSLRDLVEMGALNADFELTKLGRHLSSFGFSPQLGMMMIYAVIFDCVEPISSVVAFLSYKDIFMVPLGNKKGRRELKAALEKQEVAEEEEILSELMMVQLELDGDMCSDHLMRVKAVQEYQLHKDTDPDFCYEKYLNESTMIQVMAMRRHIVKSLARNQFTAKARDAEVQDIHKYTHVLRSVICAGLYPNTAELRIKKIEQEKKGEMVEELNMQLYQPSGQPMMFHQKSVNSKKKAFDTNCFVYYQAIHSNMCMLHDTTMVYGLSLCLFARDAFFQEDDGIVVVDDLFRFKVSPGMFVLIQYLRVAMKNIFNKTVNNPHYRQYKKQENEAIQLIVDVLAMAEQ